MALSELTIDHFMSQSVPVRVMTLLGIFLLIVLLAYFILMKPRLEQLTVLKKQRIDLEKTYQADDKTVAKLTAYQAELKSSQTIENTMQSQLISPGEFSHLIESIAKLADANGLELNLLKPASEKKQALYSAMPTHISVTGDYAHVIQFLNQLLSFEKIITINELSIAPATDARYLSMKLSLTAYRYSSEAITRGGLIHLSDLSGLISGTDKIPLKPNPFELSLSTENLSKEPLTTYTLASLHMVGTIEKSGKIWALVATEAQTIFRVTIGMPVGELEGKVIAVDSHEIKIMQMLQNGAKREVSLKMSGEK